MIKITAHFFIPESELNFTFIASPGPGGQNVNKVATTAVLRFNVMQSQSLTDAVKQRLLKSAGNKINSQGELIIKASRYRTQERNKHDAIHRLIALLQQAAVKPKVRKKSKPTFASIQQRLASKKIRSQIKTTRRNKPTQED